MIVSNLNYVCQGPCYLIYKQNNLWTILTGLILSVLPMTKVLIYKHLGILYVYNTSFMRRFS